MAKLINGNGNPAVYANEDSDWFAAIMGNQTSITAIGEQFRADQADANTIEVFDGVIITKEGRRIQLDANQVDLFEIPTGTQGQTNYYIIGYHLYTDTDSNQFCEVFVQLMESASDTIPEDTFRGGADEVFVSLYRVTQVGLNITDIDLLLPTIKNLLQISADLIALEGRVMRDLDYSNIVNIANKPNGEYTPTKDGIFYCLIHTSTWTKVTVGIGANPDVFPYNFAGDFPVEFPINAGTPIKVGYNSATSGNGINYLYIPYLD